MAYWVLATVGWATRSDGISANGRAAVLGGGDERVRVAHDTILTHAATSMTYGGDRRLSRRPIRRRHVADAPAGASGESRQGSQVDALNFRAAQAGDVDDVLGL